VKTVLQALLDRLDKQAEREHQVLLGIQVQLVRLEVQVKLVLAEQQDQQVQLARLGILELQVERVQQDLQDLSDIPDRLAQLVKQVRQ